ncbi:MAG: thioredoxin family protein [Alphaproteobacteria bacterium]|nr:thioredoxin family protein [Alphaproteobacteria bacterium]
MAIFRVVFQAVVLSLAFSAAAAAQTTLLMFEEIGCPYCEQWRAEVGVVYSKTEEGKRAPVKIILLGEPLPEGVSIGAEPFYTPTFVLLDDGREVGRIEGYPGEAFFYGLLNRMLNNLDKRKAGSG